MTNRIAYSVMAACAAVCVATSGQAASVLNIDGSVTLDATDPFSFQYNYNGFMSDAQVPVPGLTSTILFNFLGTSGNLYNFSYTLSNTSSGEIDVSRVTIFGFNSNPDLTSASVGAGNQFNVISAGNQPNGLASLELCFKDDGNSNNCTGASDGVNKGGSASGTFALGYNPAATSITLSGFSVRYQGIDADGPNLDFDGDSASGLGSSLVINPNVLVPEPATWALMIAGFGLTGAALRRRRRMTALSLA
jgi:PEP-CTERM motif